MLSTWSVPADDPSSTVTVPDAGIDWTPPAWSVPVHRVAPEVDWASTQHGADALTVIV